MDPISLIVGALAAGAAAGLTDTAAGAVKGVQVGDHNTQTNTFTTPPAVAGGVGRCG